MTTPQNGITLTNGVRSGESVLIPQVGFGTWKLEGPEAQVAVEDAIATGYRHIDTAAAYYNEEEVGAGIKASGVPREDIFVTTKLRNGDQGYESTLAAFEESRKRLGLDVIDLFLEEEAQSLASLCDTIGKQVSLQVESIYTQEQYDIILI